MKIDLDEKSEKYYSQLNNALQPFISCQCTSMIAGLDIGEFGLKPIESLDYAQYKQPEDKLRWFMTTNPDVLNFYMKSHPNSGIPIPEWADCMVYAVNKLYGKNIVYFDDKITVKSITADLKKKLPIYVSMKYPDNKNFSGKPAPVDGHIVLVIGIDDTSIILHDPYKNHLLEPNSDPDRDTKIRIGSHNVYTADEFTKHFKGYGIRYQKG